MKNFKKMCEERPLLVSIGVVAVMFVIIFLPLDGLFTGFMGEQEAGYLTGIIEQTAAGLLSIYVIRKAGLLKQAGFGNKVKEIWLIWPMVLFVLFVGSDFFFGAYQVDTSKPLRVFLLVLVYMSTGFIEEILCRGFVQTVLLQKWGTKRGGNYAALFVASLMFGMMHIVNFFRGKMSLLTSFTQMTYAIFIGFFFGACLIRCKNIWVPVILHGLIDVFSSLDEVAVGRHLNKGYQAIAPSKAVALILIALPLLISGLIIVRKVFKRGEMKECTNC